MTRPVHYAITNDWGLYVEENVPVCGDDFRRTKIVTDDPAKVTCRECLTLCGYEAAPDEQLTVVQSDPMQRAA